MMRSGDLHIIKKQVLDIETDVQNNVYQLQNNIKELYYARMLPLLEEACNHYDSGDIVRVDQLILDLGEVSLKQMDEELVRVFESKLHEQLHKLFYLSEAAGTDLTEVKAERIPRDKSDLELIIYFLKTGVLPWWKKEIALVEIENIFMEQIQKNPLAVKTFITAQLRNSFVMNRLALQFSEKINDRIFILFSSAFPVKTNQFVQKLKHIFLQFIKSEQWPQKTRFLLFQELIGIYAENKINPGNEKQVLRILMHTVQQEYGVSEKRIIEILFRIATFASPAEKKEYGVSFLKKLKAALQEIAPHVVAEILKTVSGSKERPKKSKLKEEEIRLREERDKISSKKEKAQDRLHDESGFSDKKWHKLPKQKELQKTSMVKPEAESVDEIYVKNAGLILISNYLPFYFRHVGLTADGDFIQDEARYRAVHLLQYIVSGVDTSPEYELILNKLLCGVPIFEPLEQSIVITEQEKTEAEKMLLTVIDHWGALGKTSAIALRQSFLNRHGMLLNQQSSWILRVEDSGIDILLDKIPWSYGIVNFKWMEKPIYTEWR